MSLFKRAAAAAAGWMPRDVLAVALRRKSTNSLLGATWSTSDPSMPAWLVGQPTASGKTVDQNSALQQGTVFTCVRIIAESLGQLSGCGAVFEKQPNGDLIEIEHDLSPILFATPNADMDNVECHEALGANLALVGNSYSLRNLRSDGQVSSIYPIPSDRVQPKRLDDGTIVYQINDRGKWETYTREKIWHVKGFGSTGLIGYSPIGYLRQMIGMGLATEEWQAKFFANGAMPTWLMSVPMWLEPNERAAAKKNLLEVFGGAGNAYKPQLLEGGITATAATMPLQDAQFLQLKDATRDDIFGIYRIPPHMGGNLARSTNNNIEQQALEFIMYCLTPYLNRLEASARRWLLPVAEQRRLVIRYDVDELMRADSAARASFHSIMVQNGMESRNEGRAANGMRRANVPGMDDYTAQVNLVPVDMMRTMADKAATAPAPTPATSQAPQGTSKEIIVFPAPALPAPSDIASLFERANVTLDVKMGNVGAALEAISASLTELRKDRHLPEERLDEVAELLSVMVERQRSGGGVQEDALGRLIDAVSDLKSTVLLPNEVVYGPEGDPIGSKKVIEIGGQR